MPFSINYDTKATVVMGIMSASHTINVRILNLWLLTIHDNNKSKLLNV